MLILFWIALVSFLILVVALFLRLSAIRAGRVDAESQPGIYSAIQPKIDYLAMIFVVALRETSKFFSLHILLWLRNKFTLFRKRFVAWEKRYSRFVDLIHGRHALPDAPTNVSSFLKEIKEQADEIHEEIHGTGEEKKPE